MSSLDPSSRSDHTSFQRFETMQEIKEKIKEEIKSKIGEDKTSNYKISIGFSARALSGMNYKAEISKSRFHSIKSVEKALSREMNKIGDQVDYNKIQNFSDLKITVKKREPKPGLLQKFTSAFQNLQGPMKEIFQKQHTEPESPEAKMKKTKTFAEGKRDKWEKALEPNGTLLIESSSKNPFPLEVFKDHHGKLYVMVVDKNELLGTGTTKKVYGATDCLTGERLAKMIIVDKGDGDITGQYPVDETLKEQETLMQMDGKEGITSPFLGMRVDQKEGNERELHCFQKRYSTLDLAKQTPTERLNYFASMAMGCASMQDTEIIHNDMKLDNFFEDPSLQDKGKTLFADFGSAFKSFQALKLNSEGKIDKSNLTLGNMEMQPPEFSLFLDLAIKTNRGTPEERQQVMDSFPAQINANSNTWSLGCSYLLMILPEEDGMTMLSALKKIKNDYSNDMLKKLEDHWSFSDEKTGEIQQSSQDKVDMLLSTIQGKVEDPADKAMLEIVKGMLMISPSNRAKPQNISQQITTKQRMLLFDEASEKKEMLKNIKNLKQKTLVISPLAKNPISNTMAYEEALADKKNRMTPPLNIEKPGAEDLVGKGLNKVSPIAEALATEGLAEENLDAEASVEQEPLVVYNQFYRDCAGCPVVLDNTNISPTMSKNPEHEASNAVQFSSFYNKLKTGVGEIAAKNLQVILQQGTAAGIKLPLALSLKSEKLGEVTIDDINTVIPDSGKGTLNTTNFAIDVHSEDITVTTFCLFKAGDPEKGDVRYLAGTMEAVIPKNELENELWDTSSNPETVLAKTKISVNFSKEYSSVVNLLKNETPKSMRQLLPKSSLYQ